MIKVYLDPGHGGTDPGAVGNGMMEKDLTLKISKYTRDYLLQNYQGVQVRMSRTNDKTVSLRQRTNDANRWGADVLASVHINAHMASASGYEDFIYNGSLNRDTQRLQDNIHNEMKKVFKEFPNRGQKRANFHMLREARASAILPEFLFITNKNDAAFLKKDSNLKNIGEHLAIGIAKHLDLERKTAGRPKPSDNKRWRIQTGLFDSAESYARAINQLEDKYNWLLHEKANTTELNPRYRIVTGLFTGKNVAEFYAKELTKEFGWNTHVIEG